MRDGIAIHMYTCNANMGNKTFVDSDGDLLIGVLCIITSGNEISIKPCTNLEERSQCRSRVRFALPLSLAACLSVRERFAWFR